MELEEIFEDAPEEWLCGAIGLALRRAMPQDVVGNDLGKLVPVPPPGSRPLSAFSHKSRHAFRKEPSEVSAATDADIVLGEFTAPTPPLKPAAPTTPRPDSAASSTIMRSLRAVRFSSDSIITVVDPDLVLSEP